jgi:ribokinase
VSLLVVGSLHLDVIVRSPHLPILDETVTGSAVDYVFGGKGGNQAVVAARLGAKVSFVGCVGTDQFGEVLRKELQKNEVDISQLQAVSGASGMSVAIVDAQGNYGAVIVSAANLQIQANQIKVPTGTKLVLLQNEVPADVNVAVARKAKAVGASVWLNAAPARVLPNDLLQFIDLLIVNRVEDAFYKTTLEVDRLTTLGSQGVHYAGQIISGFDVNVISTHGAGDAFLGALAAQLTQGVSLIDGITFAQATAALHISQPADKRTWLTPQKVQSFLSSWPSR